MACWTARQQLREEDQRADRPSPFPPGLQEAACWGMYFVNRVVEHARPTEPVCPASSIHRHQVSVQLIVEELSVCLLAKFGWVWRSFFTHRCSGVVADVHCLHLNIIPGIQYQQGHPDFIQRGWRHVSAINHTTQHYQVWHIIRMHLTITSHHHNTGRSGHTGGEPITSLLFSTYPLSERIVHPNIYVFFNVYIWS